MDADATRQLTLDNNTRRITEW